VDIFEPLPIIRLCEKNTFTVCYNSTIELQMQALSSPTGPRFARPGDRLLPPERNYTRALMAAAFDLAAVPT